MTRSNDTWLTQLRGDGPEQHAALADLRDALIRGLRRGLSGRYAADDGFIEDAAQDGLMRVLDKLDQFAGRSRFITWATAIAIRVAMSELRRKRWRDVSLDELAADGHPSARPTSSEAAAPEALHERHTIVETMRRIIDHELTDRQRAALLAELRGMPQDEIARQLGSNRNALYKLTHDARKRLKRHLEAAGYHADDVAAAFAE